MILKSIFAGLLAAAIAFALQYLLLDDWTRGISSSIATGAALFAITLWSEKKRHRHEEGQRDG